MRITIMMLMMVVMMMEEGKRESEDLVYSEDFNELLKADNSFLPLVSFLSKNIIFILLDDFLVFGNVKKISIKIYADLKNVLQFCIPPRLLALSHYPEQQEMQPNLQILFETLISSYLIRSAFLALT